MILLGFDTATSSTAVALHLADGSALQARDDPPPGQHPGHATRLLDMARELLAGAGVAWSELDRIAVGVGPGTFTGLRVGVATARGLAQSLACELVGVSSLQALAAPALAQAPAGAVLPVIDARRGEVFAAPYLQDGSGVPRQLAAPRALAPADLGGALAQATEAGGPREGWLAVGGGAVRYRGHLTRLAIVPPDASPLHAISAQAICELAATAAAPAELSVLPDYRRRPDAEIAVQSADAQAGARGALAVSARGR